MRKLELTSTFKRDYKRETKGKYRTVLESSFVEVVTALVHDQPLAGRYQDHSLIGNWKDHQDCHIKPDLILIYRKPDPTCLQLVRLGSHAKLGL